MLEIGARNVELHLTLFLIKYMFRVLRFENCIIHECIYLSYTNLLASFVLSFFYLAFLLLEFTDVIHLL